MLRKNKISKIFGLLFLLFLIPFQLKAQDLNIEQVSNDEVEYVVVATVNVYDFKVINQDKNKFDLSFLITNREKNQSNVNYAIKLFSKDENGQAGYLIDEKVYQENLSLAENSEVLKNIKYQAPNHLKGEYFLQLDLKNNQALNLAFSQLEVELNGEGEYLEVLSPTCFLTIGEEAEEYQLLQGVDLDSNEDLFLSCEIKNNSSESLEINPEAETFFRSTLGEKLNKQLLEDKINLNPEEKTVFKIKIPIETKPQAYDAKINFSNNKEIPSNTILVHYVTRGKSATLNNLLLDKNYYNKGDKAKIKFFYAKSADNFYNSRGEGTKIDSVLVNLVIMNSDQEKCGEEVRYVLNDDLLEQEVDYQINNDCSNPSVKASIIEKETNQVLTSTDFNFNSEEQFLNKEEEKEATTKTPISLIIFISGLILMILLIIIPVVFRGKKNLSIFLAFFLGIGLFGFFDSTSADTVRVVYSVAHPDTTGGAYEQHDLTLVYGMNKTIYNPGEVAEAHIGIHSLVCNNSAFSSSFLIRVPEYSGQENWAHGVTAFTVNEQVPTAPGNYNTHFYWADNRIHDPSHSFIGKPEVDIRFPFQVVCPPGQYDNGGTCVGYKCTGSDPIGATLCPGADQGLTVDTRKTAVTSCYYSNGQPKPEKCIYLCDSSYNALIGPNPFPAPVYTCGYTAPGCSLNWDKSSLAEPDSATVTWTTGLATSAYLECIGPGTNYPKQAVPANSSATFNFYSNHAGDQTCILTVSNTSGTKTCQDTLTVTSFTCGGPIPSNATICQGDNLDLTKNYTNTLVDSCGSEKCEYFCNQGYVKSGSVCVYVSGPTCSISWDKTSINTGETANVSWDSSDATSANFDCTDYGTGSLFGVDIIGGNVDLLFNQAGNKQCSLTVGDGYGNESTCSTGILEVKSSADCKWIDSDCIYP